MNGRKKTFIFLELQVFFLSVLVIVLGVDRLTIYFHLNSDFFFFKVNSPSTGFKLLKFIHAAKGFSTKDLKFFS